MIVEVREANGGILGRALSVYEGDASERNSFLLARR